MFCLNRCEQKRVRDRFSIHPVSRFPSQPEHFPLLSVTGIVGSLNSENKVDLTNPQYTVVVEIIKAVCCLSVVQDYMLFRKYNLQEVVKSAKEPPQLPPKQADGKEAKLEPGDTAQQNDPAEGNSDQNNQQVAPETSEKPGQTQPGLATAPVREGGANPELVGQVTENDLS